MLHAIHSVKWLVCVLIQITTANIKKVCRGVFLQIPTKSNHEIEIEISASVFAVQ